MPYVFADSGHMKSGRIGALRVVCVVAPGEWVGLVMHGACRVKLRTGRDGGDRARGAASPTLRLV